MNNQPVDARQLTMADLGPLEALLCEGFPPLWTEMATSLYGGLMSVQPSLAEPEILAECAVILVRKLAKELGGGAFYLPKGVRFESRIRADKIRLEFRGNNARQLGIKYELSEQQVRNIVGA